MKIFRRILLGILLIGLLALAWMWWNRPQKVDMATYAPASSLLYLEANSLMDIADGITATTSWKSLKPFLGETGAWASPQTRRLIAWTGIGPTPSVILTRAQVAIVMLDLGAREQGDSITLKPEAALLIETHTSKVRIQSTVEAALGKFAERSYQRPTFKRVQADGDEFLVWTAPENNRQIVAVLDETLVILANSERAVRACLEARRGLRPSLHDDPGLKQIRSGISSDTSLASGFVSAAHTGDLLSLGIPVLFGRAPGGLQFEGLIAQSGPKILGSAGWSARLVNGAIEDRYFFTLTSPVVTRMRPTFQSIAPARSPFAFIPQDAHSLTSYNFKEPAETWRGLQTTLSSQLDTLSAILLVSVLKSALLPYGVEDPEKFLNFVGPEIMTARLRPDASGSILIAKVRDEAGLRQLLKNSPKDPNDESEKQLATHFQDGYVLIGSNDDVQICAQAGAHNLKSSSASLTHFGPDPRAAAIITYTKDTQRVRNFISALARAQGKPPTSDTERLNQSIEALPYSVTETSLNERGLERTTSSAFGQFSALVPLLFPED